MPSKLIVDQLTSMRNQLIYHSIMGEYKEYVALRKNFAKKYITFPEDARYIAHQNIPISIFSKFGINVIKTWFKDLFRKKSFEEKEMKKIATEFKAREKSGWNV